MGPEPTRTWIEAFGIGISAHRHHKEIGAMVLRQLNPFSEIRRMDEAMVSLWRGHYRPVITGRTADEVATYAIPLDVIRDEDEVVIRASVPGVDPKDIEVTVDDGVLTIAGTTGSERDEAADGYVLRERRSGRFARSIRLPDYLDADRAESTYEHGVLSVKLPKSESARVKRLEIKISEN